MKIIPHRLTVAGEATARSSTSNCMQIVGESLIISPLTKQSFLLSSKTVFMFSIQIASTGPSHTIHFLSSLSSFVQVRTIVERIPSVHSCVFSSKLPYSWPIVIDLGFIIVLLVVLKNPIPLQAVSASARIRLQHVLPPPVGPTSIKP